MPCSLYLLIIQEVCLKNNPLIGKSIKFSLFFCRCQAKMKMSQKKLNISTKITVLLFRNISLKRSVFPRMRHWRDIDLIRLIIFGDRIKCFRLQEVCLKSNPLIEKLIIFSLYSLVGSWTEATVSAIRISITCLSHVMQIRHT